MGLFKKLEAKEAGVSLEKPEFVIVEDGNAEEVQKILEQLAARFGGADKVNAVVAILPVYENMPSENKMRNSKEKGEYLSAVKYADNRPVTLPFAFTENPLRVSFGLSEKVARDDDENDGAADGDATE